MAFAIPIFVAGICIVLGAAATVGIVVGCVGRKCPDVCEIGGEIGTGFLAVAVNSVEAHGCSEPLGEVEAAFIAEVEIVRAVVDDA